MAKQKTSRGAARKSPARPSAASAKRAGRAADVPAAGSEAASPPAAAAAQEPVAPATIPAGEPESRQTAEEERLFTAVTAEESAAFAAQAAVHAAEELRSFIDAVTHTDIRGWAMSTLQPQTRLVIGLSKNGTILSRTTASVFRQDLLDAGIGDGFHAFTLPMPGSLLDGEEHVLEIVEVEGGARLTPAPIAWRWSAGSTDASRLKPVPLQDEGYAQLEDLPGDREARSAEPRLPAAETQPPAPAARRARKAAGAAPVEARVLLDVSELVHQAGHGPSPTGIQRAHASIVRSIVEGELLPEGAALLLSYDPQGQRWLHVPGEDFAGLMRDLALSAQQGRPADARQEARGWIGAHAQELDDSEILDDGVPSVLCVLGGAWTEPDYFRRAGELLQRFDSRLVVAIHDLAPIYARSTCLEAAASAYERSLRRAIACADGLLAASASTQSDLRRYAAEQSLALPAVAVTQEGSSFDEFLSPAARGAQAGLEGVPERFVLFVAAIEGRKNHRLLFDLWKRMIEAGDDPPALVCVGRVGWKAEGFIAALGESNYLGGRIVLMRDLTDPQLKSLYDRCLFTVFPSAYEGWGLPVSESLAAGKVCVCSDRASIPEVAGSLGVHIDIDDEEQCHRVLRGLVRNPASLKKLQDKIARGYKRIAWKTVAERVVKACLTAAREARSERAVTLPLGVETSFALAPLEESEIVRHANGSEGPAPAGCGHFLPAPLRARDFLRGVDVRSGWEWAEPEEWGTWMCGSSGELAFDVEPDGSDAVYVHLRLRGAGALADRRVRFTANGEDLGVKALGPQAQDVVLRIGAAPAPQGGPRHLRLRVELEPRPQSQEDSGSPDPREPTLGFERLVVVPENNLKARLDILTRLLQ